MELIYILIEDVYLLGKHKEVSFSGEYTVTIQKYNDKTKELILKIDKSSLYPSSMFSNRILNITGIIGENGSGKTTFFEFLLRILTNQANVGEKFLAIFKNGDRLEGYHTLYDLDKVDKYELPSIKDEWSVQLNSEPIENNITSLRFDGKYIQPKLKKSIEALSNSLPIHYSGIFDLKGYPYSIPDRFIDVSTNRLIGNNFEPEKDSLPDKDPLFIFKHKNTLRQFKLVESGLLEKIDFNLPKSTTISFARVKTSDIKNSRDINNNDIEIFNYLIDAIRQFYPKTKKDIDDAREKHDEQSLKNYYRLRSKVIFVESIIANFFANIDYSEYYGNWSKVKIDDLKKLDIFDAVIYFFATQEIIDKRPIKRLIKYAYLLIDDESNSTIDEREFAVVIWKYKHVSQLISLYEDYLKSFTKTNEPYGFLEIYWRDLSSGEKAYLDLYSRLHYAKEFAKNDRKNEKKKNINTVYILLDEAEIGFHPEWQRTYIYNLNEFLPHLFTDKALFKNANVQLFIASHSPFVASDLPKSNLIFLKKSKDSIFNISSFEKEQTFGANIHTLLSDAFFLQKGLIGEFAKTRIFELMHEIESLENPNDQTIETFKQRVEIIGEPLIRHKLYELLLSKVGTSDIENRRTFLQKELDKLNMKKKK